MNSSFFQFSVSNVYYVLSGIAQRWQHMTYTKRVRTLASFRHPDSVTLALRQLRTLPFKQLMTFFSVTTQDVYLDEPCEFRRGSR